MCAKHCNLDSLIERIPDLKDNWLEIQQIGRSEDWLDGSGVRASTSTCTWLGWSHRLLKWGIALTYFVHRTENNSDSNTNRTRIYSAFCSILLCCSVSNFLDWKPQSREARGRNCNGSKTGDRLCCTSSSLLSDSVSEHAVIQASCSLSFEHIHWPVTMYHSHTALKMFNKR